MTIASYTLVDTRAGECCRREHRAKKQNQTKTKQKTEKLWDLVFGEENFLFLHDVLFSNSWQEVPQEFPSVRGWAMGGQGRGCRVPIACLDLQPCFGSAQVSLGYDYTILGLRRVNEQHGPWNRNSQGRDLGGDWSKTWKGTRIGIARIVLVPRQLCNLG